METVNTEQRRVQAEALRTLGEALGRDGFDVRVVNPAGAGPFLRVTSGQAAALSENVTCTLDADRRMVFAYSWGDPIAPVGDVHAAVARLARVLAPLDAHPSVMVRAASGQAVAYAHEVAEARRAALEVLAALLVEQQYVVQVGEFHLVVSDRVGGGARLVEVWCQGRPDRGAGLYFTWAGGAVVCGADRPTDALVAVETVLLPSPR
ncbi:hypothetical protein [Actinocorallia lasiicapitis]